MNPEIDGSEIIEQRLCCDCQKEFTSRAIMLFGKPMFRTVRCSTCEKAWVDRKREEEAKQRAAEIASHWADLCPFEFRTIEEGGDTDIAHMDAESKNWRKVLDWQYGHKGLLVRGETGKCKTRALWRLLRRQFDSGRGFVALTAYQFECQTRDAMRDFQNGRWFACLSDAPILFLDDLGKMAATECIQSALFGIIDERTANGRPILATTNDTRKTLAARMSDDRGEPLVRRLCNYCELMTL